MSLVTLMAPNFVMMLRMMNEGIITQFEPLVMGMVWSYSSIVDTHYAGFQFLTPTVLFVNSVFTFAQVIFSFLVVRYCQGKVSFRLVMVGAIISIALPVYVGISVVISSLMVGRLAYSGIIPVQLTVGYLIIRFKGAPEAVLWAE